MNTTMKTKLLVLLGFALLSTPLTTNAEQYGDFTYYTDGINVAIIGYTGPGGAVDIPATIDGLPVVSIGYGAFYEYTNLASPASGTMPSLPATTWSVLQSATASPASVSMRLIAAAVCTASLSRVTRPAVLATTCSCMPIKRLCFICSAPRDGARLLAAVRPPCGQCPPQSARRLIMTVTGWPIRRCFNQPLATGSFCSPAPAMRGWNCLGF